MKKDNIMERLLTGEEVSEQLKFENLVTEEKEIPEIIPIRAAGLQPRKLEDVILDSDILRDTYIIYPDGGYHPFYRVPNTFPIYQQKIWPFIKRIKFSKQWKSKEVLNILTKKPRSLSLYFFCTILFLCALFFFHLMVLSLSHLIQ